MTPSPRSLTVAARLLGAASLALLLVGTTGCPNGKCWVRFQQVENGQVKSDECLVDTCPKNSGYDNGKSACVCKTNFVTFGGACKTLVEANASCAKGYVYSNSACVAQSCPAGQVMNAASGGCENKTQTDAVVAANAGVSIGQGQSIGCPAGQTYVVNGREGACVPNELTCGEGTRFENGACVATNCPAGTVFVAASNQCQKIGNDASSFSVQVKLDSEMSQAFCAPHARNPAGFHVPPGGALTIKVSVTITVPGNQIDQAQLAAVHTTNLGGAELTPALYPEVTNIDRHVSEGVINDIRALGGKSLETQATAEVTCTIKRAPIQVIETKGGGV